MYRMQNTVDHINVAELASVIGVDLDPTGPEKASE